MGYDPSGLKLFKSDLAEAKQASIDMIAGMSKSAGAIDPMMGRLSDFYREQAKQADEANRAALAKKHDALNAGPSGTQDFTKLEASLKAQADRDYYRERAKIRDQQLRDDVQAEKVAAINAKNEKLAGHKAEADALRWQLMTEKEKFALRKKADLEHLQMLQQAGAISKTELATMSQKAGTLGLGNVPGATGSAGGGVNYGMIAAQLGFGLQDFTSQLQNSKNLADGLGRGVMAVSNNVQMLGAAFGPTGMAITAIGGALAGVILPHAIKWLMQTKDTEAATKRIHEEITAISSLSRNVIEVKFQGGAARRVDDLKEQKAIAQAQAQILKDQRQNEIQIVRQTDREIKEMRKAGARERDLPLDRQEQVNKNKALRDRVALNEDAKLRAKELAKVAGDEDQKVIDADKQLRALTGNSEIEQARKTQLEIRELTHNQTSEQMLANSKRLEDKRDSIASEIKLYEVAAEKESEANRKARELRLSELKRDAETTAQVLAAITTKANAAAAGERLREERDVTERKLAEADKIAKRMGIDAVERFSGIGFTNPALAAEEAQREREAMRTRQEREMRELTRQTALMPNQSEVLALQAAKQEAETARLTVKQKEDEIARLGPAAGPSAGLNINSSQGVSAINRALSGISEQDYQKQMLEQLKLLNKKAEERVKDTGFKVLALSG